MMPRRPVMRRIKALGKVMEKANRRRKPRSEPKRLPAFVLSRKVMTLANLLKRGAGIRYRRLLGLPQGEWGVIAQLGARAPRTLGDLAAGMGLDITQISRSVSDLVERGLVTRSSNPLNNREVLIALSRKGEAANAVIVDAGSRVNETLLDGLSDRERTALEALLVRFTERAERLLALEQESGDSTLDGPGASHARDPGRASAKF
jgi:DNA-binding MarR family transcriptional regulator